MPIKNKLMKRFKLEEQKTPANITIVKKMTEAKCEIVFES